jgi:hypothetical protein
MTHDSLRIRNSRSLLIKTLGHVFVEHVVHSFASVESGGKDQIEIYWNL